MLADILPTSYEVGAVNGRVSPGDTVAIVGAGPIGLSAILGSRLYSPSRVIAIDLADARLDGGQAVRRRLHDQLDDGGPVSAVFDVTDGLGADVVIEAVGIPETFELCTKLVRPGGHVANIGVHGKPARLDLDRLWIRNVTITTGLVDTYSTPTLLNLVKTGQTRREAVRHAPVPDGRDHAGVRRVRRRGRHRRAQGRAAQVVRSARG